jgi:opacity protein-like surface antigen
MKFYLRSAIAAASLACAASAQAADPAGLPPLPLPDRNPAYVQEYFSPWYIRVDGAYRSSSLSSGDAFGTAMTSGSVDNLATIGAGIGFKYNWFRADLTSDYGMQPTVRGTAGGVPYAQSLQNITTLVNGYFDLGTWWGFTPYVGAGAGYTYLKPSEFTIGGVTTPISSETWQFSWALMGGASFTITQSLLFDVSYRYLDLGATETNVPAVGRVNFGEWTAQEIRFGFRYLIP